MDSKQNELHVTPTVLVINSPPVLLPHHCPRRRREDDSPHRASIRARSQHVQHSINCRLDHLVLKASLTSHTFELVSSSVNTLVTSPQGQRTRNLSAWRRGRPRRSRQRPRHRSLRR